MAFSRELFEESARNLGREEEMIRLLQAYASKLATSDLPVIFSPKHWALMMGYEDDQILAALLMSRENYYREFGIKKRAGGVRFIMAPEKELKTVQHWVKENILDKLVFPDYVSAYRKGMSILDNARPHARQEIVLKFDLRHYFDTITQSRVYGLFLIMGFHKAIAIDLAAACCVQPSEQHIKRLLKAGVDPTLYQDGMLGVLPQGAPTSPTLSNLAAFRLDVRLNAYAQKNGFVYTRYADDLTFSGNIVNKLKKSVIRKIIRDEGFKLNERKGSYRARSGRQSVTGLNVNEGVTVPKVFRKKITTHIHNCLRFGPQSHLTKMDLGKRINFKDWLLGSILFIKSVHPEQGRLMREKFDRINWF